jgi:hypothetical protein
MDHGMPLRAPPDDRKRTRARISYELPVPGFQQPDDVTCGPTCLRKIYHFYGYDLPHGELLGEIDRNEDGGTLAVHLAISALKRGFGARIYSYDLRIFDPSWASLEADLLRDKIEERLAYLKEAKAARCARAFIRFLKMGGEMAFDELTPALLKAILNRNHPILAGLSATHLYKMPRERHHPVTHELLDDDIAGEPIGHFVVVSGYQHWGRQFSVRDPSAHIPPTTEDGRVLVDAQRLTNAILLGDLTYDAVLLELWPNEEVEP